MFASCYLHEELKALQQAACSIASFSFGVIFLSLSRVCVCRATTFKNVPLLEYETSGFVIFLKSYKMSECALRSPQIQIIFLYHK